MPDIFEVPPFSLATGSARLYAAADLSSGGMNIGRGIFIKHEDAREIDGFVLVEWRPMKSSVAGQTGWVEKKFLTIEIDEDSWLEVFPNFDEKFFVRHCVRHQLLVASGGIEPEFSAAAEYVIGLALILTGLDQNKFDGAEGRKGPYLISNGEWDDFKEAHSDQEFGLFHRFKSLKQVSAIDWLSRRDFKKFRDLAAEAGIVAELASETGGEPFVPSFLDLLHCRLLGVKGAFAIDQASRDGRADIALVDAVEGFEAASDWFSDIVATNSDTTIQEFVDETSKLLNEAILEGFDKIKEHAREYIHLPSPGPAPWMSTAEQEKTDWGGRPDSDPDRLERVKDYFESFGPRPDKRLAWCGAFASYCMVDNDLKGALIKDPGWAANWKTWGVEIPLGTKTEDIPLGAVIVLSPPPNSNASGHVTFFHGRADDQNQIMCLGGNQSQTCNSDERARSRVVAIRWLETETDSHAEALSEAATRGAKMVVAQTIFGEARGREEGRRGREAVANVIVNRVKERPERPHFGSGFIGVCHHPKQFSCWNRNDPNLKEMLDPSDSEMDVFNECLEIAGEAIDEALTDHTNGALHYHKDTISKPDWAFSGSVSARIGTHIFYVGVA